MRKAEINGHKLELFDSIDELPIVNFHKFNKYMLVDSGIGSDINDINAHISKINAFMDKGELDHAKNELENLRRSLYMVSEENNVKHLSYMFFIKSIDGKSFDDISDSNIKATHDLLNKEKLGVFEKLFEGVKKKNKRRFGSIFSLSVR